MERGQKMGGKCGGSGGVFGVKLGGDRETMGSGNSRSVGDVVEHEKIVYSLKNGAGRMKGVKKINKMVKAEIQRSPKMGSECGTEFF